ncbi:MAG: two-component system, cell cycle sensor histidine kinase and response regulator CckA [Actinomycetota bacterium]|nr:two-component system, cell cycle sensor histidine kinase and response regulator CckA [Actinomycetota bacterium]
MPVRSDNTSASGSAARAEEALQRSEGRLRGVLHDSPLAIVELNADIEVSFWNPAAEVLYGWTLQEVEGHRPQFSRPDEEAAFDALVRRVLAGESLHNVELVRRRKNGALVNVSISMAPLRNRTGQIVGVTSAGLDVTHQRQLEAELRESQKMEGIGRLAGGIAHDFNNLLTVILGHTEQLLEDLAADGRAVKRVQAVYRAARRAADLTDQLLTFSQRQAVSGEPVDLNRVVSSMEPMLARLVGEHLDLRISLCDEPAVVTFDWSQLQQVVLNLVVNASEAMPSGGALGITTETIVTRSGPNGIRLHVSDTGVGIEDSARAHIFEPFFSTKDETKGTGLGLSTAYGLVAQHGGTVSVSTQPGAGSVFTVSLPEWAAPDPPPS